jgi:hypothetical protein
VAAAILLASASAHNTPIGFSATCDPRLCAEGAACCSLAAGAAAAGGGGGGGADAPAGGSGARVVKLLTLGDSITYGCGNTCGRTCTVPCCSHSAVPAANCSTDGSCPYTSCPTCGGGEQGSGSFRRPLKALLDANAAALLNGTRVDFVGTQVGGGLRHMGFPGYRIDQLSNRTKERATGTSMVGNWSQFRADITVVHLGSNDVMQGPYAYHRESWPVSAGCSIT